MPKWRMAQRTTLLPPTQAALPSTHAPTACPPYRYNNREMKYAYFCRIDVFALQLTLHKLWRETWFSPFHRSLSSIHYFIHLQCPDMCRIPIKSNTKHFFSKLSWMHFLIEDTSRSNISKINEMVRKISQFITKPLFWEISV